MYTFYLLLAEKLLVGKTVFFFFLGKVIRALGQLTSFPDNSDLSVSGSKLVIEAGIVGWASVFYSELRDSAREYLPFRCVISSVIDRDDSYLKQAFTKLRAEKPTHYLFDPRTGSQNPARAMLQSFAVAFFLGRQRITPIIILTDPSVRIWRYQAFLITGSTGAVVTLVDPNLMGHLFPHNRIIGPTLMPISLKTLDELESMTNIIPRDTFNTHEIFFLGSLYSNRLDFFNLLSGTLSSQGSPSELILEAKSVDVSQIDYWNRLTKFDCLLTTTFQIQIDPNYMRDRIWINQMVFRISESLAAGRLLYSPAVPGMDRYFDAEVHYISYVGVEDLARKIDYYRRHPHLGAIIATTGKLKYRELVNEKVFWKLIDRLLDFPMIAKT